MAHFTGMIRVISANAINSVYGKAPRIAFHSQGWQSDWLNYILGTHKQPFFTASTDAGAAVHHDTEFLKRECCKTKRR
jgi:hypothetical protein